MELVGTASDPFIARERIKETNPDVLTLDVEMPRMDGLTFLANLMRLRPIPTIMVSSLTERGAETTLKALELGAVDFVSKPKVDVAGTLEGLQRRNPCQDPHCRRRARAWRAARPVAVAPSRPNTRPMPSCRPPAAGSAGAAHHGSHHRRGCVDRRHGSDSRTAGGAASRLVRPW